MLDISALANKIYLMTTSELVKHRLIQSGLCTVDSEATSQANQQNSIQSKWLKLLRNEQHPDGSWGRFHTQDSKIKQKYMTTESAAWRLSVFGITRGSIIVDSLCDYMENLLNNMTLWPDAWEGNKWFKPAVPLFIASKLSIFGTEDKECKRIFNLWISILNAAFINYSYSQESVNQKANELLGTDIHKSYIGLNGINNLLLFSNLADVISADVQMGYLKWLHKLKEPIVYTNVILSNSPEAMTSLSQMQGFLRVMQLLSRFKGFADEYTNEIDWLINRQGDNGFWDFGSKLNICQLSDHWRIEINRKIDQSIYILCILRNSLALKA